MLGGITTSQFLREYWQKKPLLVRQAFPGFEGPLTAEELAGLSCEDGVESRASFKARADAGTSRGGRIPKHASQSCPSATGPCSCKR